jgi:5-methylcytosine-specific restriction endonuclease McrA
MEVTSRKQSARRQGKSQPLSRYLIKKALLNRAGGCCAHCYSKTVPVRLSRVHKKSKQPKESDYILLCHDCITEGQKKRKEAKKRLCARKAAKRKITKGGFWNKIRNKVLERDGYRCVWCNTKEHLGLGSLIPPSRGGKLIFDNYVTTCQHCRPSKGNKLPLEFIDETIDIEEYLKGELDEHLRVLSDDVGRFVKIRFFLFSEISEFLHRLTNDPEIPSSTSTRAELLNIKLLK